MIKLLLASKSEKQPALIIGGGIANFTDVAATFAGIINALTIYQDELKAKKTLIYVRRGGPNYQRGLKLMRECGEKTQLGIKVFGPETHITAIVSMALRKEKGNEEDLNAVNLEESINQQFEKMTFSWNTPDAEESKQSSNDMDDDVDGGYTMNTGTRAIVYGMQTRAVQNMLDFDYICRRRQPSVAAIVYEFAAGVHHRQFYWGNKTIMIPVYRDVESALKLNVDAVCFQTFGLSEFIVF